MKVAGIYMIINTINNHKYIGSSVDIKKRFNTHKNNFIKEKNLPNKHIQSAWNKYCEDNFEFKVIEIIINKNNDIKDFDNYLRRREDYYIQKLKPEYNCSDVGHTTTGADFYKTEEWHYKVGSGNRGIPKSEDFKIRVSNTTRGRPHTEEHNKNLKNSWTEERRRKFSEYRTGKIQSKETKEKIKLGNLGNKNHSSKSIYCIDITGIIIKKYDYIEEVKNDNFCISSVRSVLHNRRLTANGYLWKYCDNYVPFTEDELNNLKNNKHLKLKVGKTF